MQTRKKSNMMDSFSLLPRDLIVHCCTFVGKFSELVALGRVGRHFHQTLVSSPNAFINAELTLRWGVKLKSIPKQSPSYSILRMSFTNNFGNSDEVVVVIQSIFNHCAKSLKSLHFRMNTHIPLENIRFDALKEFTLDYSCVRVETPLLRSMFEKCQFPVLDTLSINYSTALPYEWIQNIPTLKRVVYDPDYCIGLDTLMFNQKAMNEMLSRVLFEVHIHTSGSKVENWLKYLMEFHRTFPNFLKEQHQVVFHCVPEALVEFASHNKNDTSKRFEGVGILSLSIQFHAVFEDDFLIQVIVYRFPNLQRIYIKGCVAESDLMFFQTWKTKLKAKLPNLSSYLSFA